MSNIPQIKLQPDVISQVGPFTIYNSTVTALTITVVLIILAVLVRRNASVKPTRLQTAFELVVETILDKMTMAFGTEERARKFFPLLFTIFIFLVLSNQFMLIPFVETVVTSEGLKLFNTPTAHYSLPIALALIMLGLSHILAFSISPLRHIGNYIKIAPFFKMKSIKELPMLFLEFFLGILDIVGEFAKLISVSTRLFGNMFAGGVVVAIISGLTFYTQFVLPIPFIVLGILSGLVQAFVFTMLGIIFISSTLNAVQSTNN